MMPALPQHTPVTSGKGVRITVSQTSISGAQHPFAVLTQDGTPASRAVPLNTKLRTARYVSFVGKEGITARNVIIIRVDGPQVQLQLLLIL